MLIEIKARPYPVHRSCRDVINCFCLYISVNLSMRVHVWGWGRGGGGLEGRGLLNAVWRSTLGKRSGYQYRHLLSLNVSVISPVSVSELQ